MAQRSIETIRNLGIIAHIDAGKTTTTERFLFYSGESHKLGEVHDGEATMDFRPDEKERGITISSAAITFYWRECEINLIDTPGHVDFVAEVERSLRVLDGALAIFDAGEGVEPQSETVWHQADRYAVPRICMINKMDKVGADFEASVRSLETRLGARTLPLQIPLGAAETFTGVIDLLQRELVTHDADSRGAKFEVGPVPDEAREACEAARDRLVETLADFSDAIAERYLAGEDIAAADLRPVIRQATLERQVFPVLCGSSLRNIGVQGVLNAVCDYLPSPADLPPVEGHLPGSEEIRRRYPRADDPFSAFLFKVNTKTSADLYYTRIYSGRAKTGEMVLNVRTGKKERLRRILRVHAERGIPQETVEAGDIVALVGLKDCATGDTLCHPDHPVEYEPIRFPDPVVSVAIEPRTSQERERLGNVLARLRREDPTFRQHIDPDTGQTILSGMGELHLEVLLNRMEREFKVQAHVGKPRVSYRETILEEVEAMGEFQRSLGNQTLHGQVTLRLTPEPATRGVRTTQGLREGDVPRELLPKLLESVRGGAEGGGAYGFPLTGVHAHVVKARVLEGKDILAALNAAANKALSHALAQVRSAVLEPIMRMEVRTPEDYLGTVLKHLNTRRALIHETQSLPSHVLIRGTAPLSEMFGFSTELRSLTQGRASFNLEPLDYQPVPDNLADQFTKRRLE